MAGPQLSPGDTAWLLAATALVLIMTPGLAFFYGGLVRRRNTLSTMMYSFTALAVGSIVWIVIAFTLTFGPDVFGFIGSLKYFGLLGIPSSALWPNTGLPLYAFVAFQLTFAAITIAIVSSAIAEKARLDTWMIFVILWLICVYSIIGHWLWGGGWASQIGALDFAGGLVVHTSSGFAALALALVTGKRRGISIPTPLPHNIPLVLIGTTLLWFGWLGFNAGSALAANGVAGAALLNTIVAPAAAGLSWMLASWVQTKAFSSVAFASGVIAGLVAITPAAGFVDPLAALIIGAVAGVWSWYWVSFRIRKGLDEVLDAWAVHGMSGVWGSLATGIFANPKIGGASGLIYGNVHQFLAQIYATIAAMAWSFTISLILAFILDKAMGWRVPEQVEYVGLDVGELKEKAYEEVIP